MSHHVLSVCIFCFICATHTPCASHAAVKHSVHHKDFTDPMNSSLTEKFQESLRDNIPNLGKNANSINHRKVKRSSDTNGSDSVNISASEQDHIKKIFLKYGEGDFMTKEGFKKFLGDLNLSKVGLNDDNHHHENDDHHDTHTHLKENTTCLEINEIPSSVGLETSNDKINETLFYKMCPILLYNLVNKDCTKMLDDHEDIEEEGAALVNNGFVWLCSILAVVVISACGVLSLAIIPVMQKRFYKPLIQFLVALAVGTLAGDALLHLLPHAMSTTHGHGHSHGHHHAHLTEDSSHDENIQKGCVAMLGLTFFFVMERLISLCVKWRKGKQKKHSHITVINDRRESIDQSNETQCMDKYNSFPYCYQDIMDRPHNTFCESDKTATTVLDPSSKSDSQKISKSSTLEKVEPNNQNMDCPSDLNICTEVNKMLTPDPKNEDYTVIVREHKSEHHGHSHKHGHVHAAPKTYSSVAWMVIMGDGLHNFTDGMAIGAAFSGSLAGGFSTTVAVFCHELPHELGDFAVLLKAGMSIKQALFYNILSSILCIFGNVFGLILGNTEYASSWVFAAAAGMFIYIALVDMIPELSSAHEDEGNVGQAVLHLGGLLCGLGIMALIAFYEHDLMTVFSESK